MPKGDVLARRDSSKLLDSIGSEWSRVILRGTTCKEPPTSSMICDRPRRGILSSNVPSTGRSRRTLCALSRLSNQQQPASQPADQSINLLRHPCKFLNAGTPPTCSYDTSGFDGLLSLSDAWPIVPPLNQLSYDLAGSRDPQDMACTRLETSLVSWTTPF